MDLRGSYFDYSVLWTRINTAAGEHQDGTLLGNFKLLAQKSFVYKATSIAQLPKVSLQLISDLAQHDSASTP